MHLDRTVRNVRFPPTDCPSCPLRLSGGFAPADDESLAQIRTIRTGSRSLSHGELIHREGEPATHAFTIYDGYAIRYRIHSSGGRQVLQFILTGDLLFHIDKDALEWPDTAEVVGHALLCSLSARGLRKLFDTRIGMAHHIAEICSADKYLLDERIVDLGLSAFNGVARLLLELFLREQDRGRTCMNRCYFPFRQDDIADALGLSSVHVSRIYRDLRVSGLMSVDSRSLTIPDPELAARRLEYDRTFLPVRPLL